MYTEWTIRSRGRLRPTPRRGDHREDPTIIEKRFLSEPGRRSRDEYDTRKLFSARRFETRRARFGARMAYLEVRDITVRYGQVTALTSVTIPVEKGELLAVVGPSGSGKSTLLLSVAGFAPVESGDIVRNGRSLINIPPYKRSIGIVFQSFALFPYLSAANNIAYPLRMRRWPRHLIEVRIKSLLDKLHLADLADRYPDELSGGQQQRVALARALAFRPELLLMDEPLGALDRELREELQFEIRRIQKEEEITILYVTHDQDEAMAIADRIAVISEARVAQLDKPQEIYRRPKTPFVAKFFGGANFVVGRVETITDTISTLAVGTNRMKAQPAAEPIEVGAIALLMFRAHDTRITIDKVESGIRCEVIRTVFLGEYTSVHLQPKDAGVTRHGSVVLRAILSDLPCDLRPGDEVYVTSEPSRTLMYPWTKEEIDEHPR
jgi:putative spermidine/putrescine transport system ATP-binding protein